MVHCVYASATALPTHSVNSVCGHPACGLLSANMSRMWTAITICCPTFCSVACGNGSLMLIYPHSLPRCRLCTEGHMYVWCWCHCHSSLAINLITWLHLLLLTALIQLSHLPPGVVWPHQTTFTTFHIATTTVLLLLIIASSHLTASITIRRSPSCMVV